MKGYAVCGTDKEIAANEFEVVNMETGEVAIDHLTVAQVQQLAEML
jgi:hypothetical protein